MSNQQIPPEAGDEINVGNIENSNVVAIGAGATAVYKQGLSVEEVAELVDELKNKEQPKVWNGDVPYMGLTAFQESDAQFFFGRESLVDELLERVKTARFIVIAGPSGSGKSSVARAGLFHALREGRLDKSDGWLLATMQPKGDPIAELATAIDRMMGKHGAGDYLRENGRSDPLALHNLIEPLLSEDGRQRCILLVDQFEETFTQTKEDDRSPFIELLTEAVRVENGRLTIILSLRSDFVSQCARYPALRALLNQQFQLVGAMDPPDLAKAITLPALKVGSKIDPELVSRIMADMKGEPGALPLMSFALRDLFEAEKTAKGEPMALTLAGYVERGGIESALERHADSVFDTFTVKQIGLARGVFSKLIEVGHGRADTRRTAVFSELVPAGVDEGAVTAVVHALAEEGVRLITTSGNATADGDGGERTVTLAHEKLIDAWPWLRQLVDENREMIILQNQINDDAAAWAKGKDAGYLYRGGRLIQVEEQLAASTPDLNKLSQTFIQASLDQRQQEIEEKEARQKRELEQAQALTTEEKKRSTLFRRALIGGGVLFLFLLAAMALAGIQTNNANKNLSVSNASGTEAANEAIIARTAEANAEIRGYEAATSEANALAGEASALAAGTAEAKAFATSEAESTRAFVSEGIAQAEAATAEYNSSIAATREQDALIAGKQSLAQSLIANSRALLSDRKITNQEMVQARLFAVEGAQLNQEVGRPQDQALSQGLLYALAVEKPGIYQPITSLTDSAQIMSVAWNGDGSHLASASSNKMITIWNTDSWQPLTTLTGHTHMIRSVVWNEDGSRLASTSDDSTVIIWNTDSWQPVTTLTSHTTRVNSVAWKGDGSRLASASDDNTVIVWDTDSWQPVTTLTNHSDAVNSVAWNEDGSRLASASDDSTVIIWQADENQPNSWHPLSTLTDHTIWVNSVAWNRDGNRLASASSDSTVIIWQEDENQMDSWQPLTTLTDHSHEVLSVVWNKDGSRLASASKDKTIIIWQADKNQRGNWQPLTTLTDHTDNVTSVAWNETGDILASASWDSNVIVWNTDSWQHVTTLTKHTNKVFDVAWNTNDSRLASATAGGAVIIWQADENKMDHWQPLITLTGHTAGVRDVAWNGDSSRLASASFDNTVIIWQADESQSNSWQPITTLTNHTDSVISLDWNKNNGRLASASSDGTIIIWDTDSWQPVTTLTSHKDGVLSVTWNENDNRLATASSDGTIIIWDTDSWQPVTTLTNRNGAVISVVWNDDGSRLASATEGGVINIWQANENRPDSWQLVKTLSNHTDNAMGVAWHGNRLASASWDNTVVVWDTDSWQPLITLTDHTDWVWIANWNGDGSRLASASDDKTIVIWAFPDFSALHCSLAGRNLSLVEWEQFLLGTAYRCTCEQWPAGEGAPADAAGCQQK